MFFESKLNIDVDDILEIELIDAINEIVDLPNQTVNIFLLEEGEDNIHTFEILNTSNNKKFTLQTPLVMDTENIDILTAVLAGAIKKVNVQVTFMLEMTYADLKKLMK